VFKKNFESEIDIYYNISVELQISIDIMKEDNNIRT
jgi:hypothetical protein